MPAVELKIEVVLPEKDRKEELSASGKGSPRAYQGNGTARHFHAEERLPAPHPYPGAQDFMEAAVCHVKDLENGQWVLGGPGRGWEGGRQAWRAWATTFVAPPGLGNEPQKARPKEELVPGALTLRVAPPQDAGSGAGMGKSAAGEGQWGVPCSGTQVSPLRCAPGER